jgi:hypothetical protein
VFIVRSRPSILVMMALVLLVHTSAAHAQVCDAPATEATPGLYCPNCGNGGPESVAICMWEAQVGRETMCMQPYSWRTAQGGWKAFLAFYLVAECGGASEGSPPDCDPDVNGPWYYGIVGSDLVYRATVTEWEWDGQYSSCSPKQPYDVQETVAMNGCCGSVCTSAACSELPGQHIFRSANGICGCGIDGDQDNYSPEFDNEFASRFDCDDSDYTRHVDYYIECQTLPPFSDHNCNDENDWDELNCNSPILVDLDGNGIDLTNPRNGVRFDLDLDGTAERVSWTERGSNDAWLVLDRNRNGLIDNSLELFGAVTDQPPSNEPNGFLALSVFDAKENGGNGDGWIDGNDSVYARLRLWVDRNHDGVSQPRELLTLASQDLRRLSLDFRDSRRRDRWGNQFRWKSRIVGLQSRWAYDVVLLVERDRSARKH